MPCRTLDYRIVTGEHLGPSVSVSLGANYCAFALFGPAFQYLEDDAGFRFVRFRSDKKSEPQQKGGSEKKEGE